jgi:hypothetical protein
MTAPVNLFIDLIELDDVTVTGNFSSLICHLQSIGMTEEYLNGYLVSVACDGAAVMFGSRGRVKKLLKQKFPSIIVWHCANHRLESAVHDVVKMKDCQRKLQHWEFVLNLGLMCDALQELSELSLQLQKRNINLYSANNKIKRLAQVFEERRISPGQYYKISPLLPIT